MKILQLTNKVPLPAHDGGAIATLTLAKGLAGAGCEVTLLAMNTSKHFVDPGIIEDFNRMNKVRIQAVPVDTSIRPLKALSNLLFSELPYNAVRFQSPAYARELENLLESDSWDFIMLENLYTCLYRDILDRYPSVPVLLRPHNVEYRIWERTAGLARGWKKIYMKLLARRIRKFETAQVNRYSALIPISEEDARQFNEMGNKKPTIVCPTGIDSFTEADHEEIAREGRSVGHLGALDWLPNQDGIRWFVRDVWPRVLTAVPDAVFNLAGRNAPRGWDHEIAGPGISFLGEISNAEAFITRQNVMVIPLFSGSGMRIKLLQYLSLGRAVVTTPVGSEGIGITPGYHALVETEPEQFAQQLIELLLDPEACRKIGQNGRDLIKEKYDNKLIINNLINFLSSLK